MIKKVKSLARNGISALLFAGLGSISLGVNAGAVPVSATILEFAEDNTLFVADSDGGQILAYTLPQAKAAKASASYKLEGAGSQIAQLLGVDSRLVSYHDIAVHPVSKEAYISLSVQKNGKRIPYVIRANQAGNFSRVDLASLPNSVKKLTDTANDKVTFWRDIPAASLGITDLDYVNGTLYVSSLSTGEFASTLRKVTYPFDNTSSTANVEIYHTVHNQTETRAPIRAMTVLDLDGVETVVAAYTCTPLVTIPTRALTDGAHVKGKTIAELGYGNTPLDVIHFSAPNPQQQREDILSSVYLTDSNGNKLKGVFLDNRFDLWSADSTSLTLLFDPGRVKTGLVAHHAMGRALQPGHQYQLHIDASAKDAEGCHLQQAYSKSFKAIEADYSIPDVSQWQISQPKQGSYEALTVELNGLMDHLSLAYRMRVKDHSRATVLGRIKLSKQEQQWHFIPDHPWGNRGYQLMVDPVLEDVVGGLEFGYKGMGAVFEELGRHLSPSPMLSSVVLSGGLLQAAGSEAQQQEWLTALISGEKRLALAVDEGPRHNPTAIELSAESCSDGYRLNGDKVMVFDGLGADGWLVAARSSLSKSGGANTSSKTGDEQGISLFLVTADMAGVSTSRQSLIDSRNIARLSLKDVVVPAENLLGELDQGLPVLEQALDLGRLCLAAEMMGAAETLFATTMEYLKTRVQFDVQIGTFQALQHRAAWCYVELELARSTLIAAMAAVDAGADDAAAQISLAKWKVGQMADKISGEAVQMHGGIGVTDELDVGLYLKRIRVAQASLGDADYHLERYGRLTA